MSQKLSQGPGWAAGPMGRLAAGRVTRALRLEDATGRGRGGGDSQDEHTGTVAVARLALARCLAMVRRDAGFTQARRLHDASATAAAPWPALKPPGCAATTLPPGRPTGWGGG